MSTHQRATYLGDRVLCPDCRIPARYATGVVDYTSARLRSLWFQCHHCMLRTYSTPLDDPGSPYLCVNCHKPPVAHRDGRCLFGPAKYTPRRELPWTMSLNVR